MRLVLAGIVAVGFAGCHHHHDGDAPPGATIYVAYGNGHPLAASSSDAFIVSSESVLADRINNHRVANGLPALIDSGSLRDLARAHAIHMAIHGFEGSVNPEGDAPGDRADAVGISWSAIAEHIDYGSSDPDDVYYSMINNPGTD